VVVGVRLQSSSCSYWWGRLSPTKTTSEISSSPNMKFKYFTDAELDCSHCQESKMDGYFMEMIEALREEMGFPFVVTSAYRCRQHPVEAPKKLSGAHSTGQAMDIAVKGEDAYRLLSGALRANFTGVGVSQKGSSRFIHLDNIQSSEGRPRPWVWSY